MSQISCWAMLKNCWVITESVLLRWNFCMTLCNNFESYLILRFTQVFANANLTIPEPKEWRIKFLHCHQIEFFSTLKNVPVYLNKSWCNFSIMFVMNNAFLTIVWTVFILFCIYFMVLGKKFCQSKPFLIREVNLGRFWIEKNTSKKTVK